MRASILFLFLLLAFSGMTQVSTDQQLAQYYYSSGDFEAYRNRRIYEVLSSKEKLSIEDMKNLQGDNFNKMAQEFLPLFLKNIKALSSFSAKDQNY